MIKVLFFDYREIETLHSFNRHLEQPAKHPGNPLFTADQPWENGNLQLFGSVVKREAGPFQLWHNVIHRPWTTCLAYAESDDGVAWRRPALDVHQVDGQRTNIVFADNAVGSAVIYDAAEPREAWRYKLLCGPKPSDCIAAYRSADGVHWDPVRRYPVIPTNPDCPIGLLQAQDGRYVAYHRWHGFGRLVFRSESWNFMQWAGEPRLVLEPDAGDPPQIQFYGLGATTYGPYELGTLWIYHTDANDAGPSKMHGYQEAELAYARSGHAWHWVA
ncbi:MAG: hypothetical protein FJ029_05955 [Actinobacteria bacterium]|nr:hypothetical protein [Actinomycetota bacterium]